jgi:hypothetical protein
VQQFKYLGSVVSGLGCQQAEITRRLCMARSAFRTLSPRFLLDHRLPLKPRINVYKAVVVPTLLYGAAESWAPGPRQLQQLESLNTACLRAMAGISWHEHVTNEEVYALTQQPAIATMLRRHRLRWLGHLARQPGGSPLLQLLFATRIAGQGGVGSEQNTWRACAYKDLSELSERTGMRDLLPVNWFELAQDRKGWAKLCAEIE